MHLLAKLVGFLAVVAITVTAFAWVLDTTLLSAHFLDHQAEASGFYSQGTNVLPLLAEHGQPGDSVMTDLVTPAYFKSQIQNLLDQLELHYKKDGPPPQLDFTDLAIKARNNGVELPPALAQPTIIADPPNAGTIRSLVRVVTLVKLAGPVIVIILLAVLAVLAHGWHRYWGVAKILIMAAILQGLLWLGAMGLPGLLGSLVSANKDLAAITPPLLALFKAIGAGVASEFGTISLGLLALAGLFLVMGLISKAGHSLHRRHKRDELRPTSDNRLNLN